MKIRITRLLALPLVTVVVLSTNAVGQGFNVDFNNVFPAATETCSPFYAAAGTAGLWNSAVAGQGPWSLLDKSGSNSAVTMTLSAGLNQTLLNLNLNYTAEDARLMRDICYGGVSESIDFGGLTNGIYDVFTYAQAPDNKAGFITGVNCTESLGGVQAVGGSLWLGFHQSGVSYAKHTATVTNGTLHLELSVIFGDMSINGIQIEGGTGNSGMGYCFGDGTGASCPCSAFGATGSGCANSTGNGALLAASGSANVNADTLVLAVTGGPPNKPGLFFQGSNQLANPVGDGVLCSNSNLRYVVNSTDATGALSQAGFGANSAMAQTLNYQYWYRDPGGSCGGGFNFTNGWVVTWQ
jgi:hypothetical protein